MVEVVHGHPAAHAYAIHPPVVAAPTNRHAIRAQQFQAPAGAQGVEHVALAESLGLGLTDASQSQRLRPCRALCRRPRSSANQFDAPRP